VIIRWSNQLQAACRRNEAASVDQEPAASFIDQRQLVKIMKMKLLIEAALRFRIAILYAEKPVRQIFLCRKNSLSKLHPYIFSISFCFKNFVIL